MEILAVPAAACGEFADLVDSMHRLRARVFGARLGWNVDVKDGRETDAYDQFNPTYLLAVAPTRVVAGCARLLPATGPTMLANTFHQLLPSHGLGPHPGMVESSRFCVDTSLDEGGKQGLLHRTTLMMFEGIIEWSVANGYHEIVTATDLRFERILKRAGWPMKRLGLPSQIGNTMAVAGTLPASVESLDRIRATADRSGMRLHHHVAA
ncbi:acyl-homoserine-lactone synthase TraI [Ciceribacter sp. RN22]|uniref:acyl-homoserine-lactone synthase n=1 Tax=Ciceribacter sp. RN22 TaxID=2954932 RepID=UPI002093902F|nr:acyl-homoserine-lactone synthase TraI [Ciceribacter sp. RN22]MCO6181044.1 acyl-homoserine-lactone synthase TraI [Ciceribacter sp. RN22]